MSLFGLDISVIMGIRQFPMYFYLLYALSLLIARPIIRQVRSGAGESSGHGMAAAQVLDNTPGTLSGNWRLVWADEFDGPS